MNNLRYLTFRNSILYFSCLIFFSCENKNESSGDNDLSQNHNQKLNQSEIKLDDKKGSRKFRDIYKNTSWGGEGLGISFSLDNLISFNFQDGGDPNVSDCYYIDEKIIYDFVRKPCSHEKIYWEVIEESEDIFNLRFVISPGTNINGVTCRGEESFWSFKVLNENELELKIQNFLSGDDKEDIQIFQKSLSSFNTTNCKNIMINPPPGFIL